MAFAFSLSPSATAFIASSDALASRYFEILSSKLFLFF
jgi:hypothetical protein